MLATGHAVPKMSSDTLVYVTFLAKWMNIVFIVLDITLLFSYCLHQSHLVLPVLNHS
jgi:hypothetical protein